MQQEAVRGRTAVELITDDGVADVLEVDADLVRPSGSRPDCAPATPWSAAFLYHSSAFAERAEGGAVTVGLVYDRGVY
jgi:hypothetical protein